MRYRMSVIPSEEYDAWIEMDNSPKNMIKRWTVSDITPRSPLAMPGTHSISTDASHKDRV